MEKEVVFQPRLFRKNGEFKTTGILEGRFVVHVQGKARVNNEIKHSNDVVSEDIGFESFAVQEIYTIPRWGSAIFRVRHDGTLQFLEENYASDD